MQGVPREAGPSGPARGAALLGLGRARPSRAGGRVLQRRHAPRAIRRALPARPSPPGSGCASGLRVDRAPRAALRRRPGGRGTRARMLGQEGGRAAAPARGVAVRA